MTNFNHAVKVVLKHEGGYVNHKKDPGGATNYGISLRYLLAQGDLDGIDNFDFDNDGDIDSADVRSMTEQDARDIYFRYWWSKFGYHKIIDIDLSTKILDMSVNMGGKQAHKLIQRAVRACGKVLKADGILGPKSFKAINNCDARCLIGAIRVECKHFYLGLIRNKPDFAVFKEGWLMRAFS